MKYQEIIFTIRKTMFQALATDFYGVHFIKQFIPQKKQLKTKCIQFN